MSDKVILLANLGSPDSTSVKDLKRYLGEFLMDERVIDIPYIARLLLVRGIIVPFRAPKSAEKYKSIWTEEGSPLIIFTQQLAEKLEKVSGIPVKMCMRYGNPAPFNVMQNIVEEYPEVKEVILVPLYPHYAMSSYETAVEHVKSKWKQGGFSFGLNVVEPFYNHPLYVKSLAASIGSYNLMEFDHVLFSYHGIPERHIFKSDNSGGHCLKVDNCCNIDSPAHNTCYRHQVFETTKLVTSELGWDKGFYSVAFQSRLGTDKWLQPATSERLKQLPAEGVKKLLVVSPAFVSDCLETLEELHVEGKEIFLEAGGERYDVVPCLNANDDWVETVVELVKG